MNLYAHPALVILGGLVAGILVLAFLVYLVMRERPQDFCMLSGASDPAVNGVYRRAGGPSWWRRLLRGGQLRRERSWDAAASVDPAVRDMEAVSFRRPGEVPVYREPDGKVLGFLSSFGVGDANWTDFLTGGGVQLERRRGVWITRSSAAEVGAAFPTFRAVALFLLALLLPIAARAADFQAADLSQLHHPAIKWGSPVCAVGYVESVRAERDGDLHVWLCGSPGKRTMPERRQGCVLGEIVPSRPLPRPPRGARVRMCGAWVESDIPHGWTELHPVSGWCSPAASCEVRP